MLKLLLLKLSISVCLVSSQNGIFQENINWYDGPENWDGKLVKADDGWDLDWDVLEEYGDLKGTNRAFSEVLEEVREYQKIHFQNLANPNPFAGDKKYEELTSELLQASESVAIKLGLYGNILTMKNWVIKFQFTPFQTGEPPKKTAKKDWLLGPLRMWMFAKNELFSKLNFREDVLPKQLLGTQLITINSTKISIIERNFVKFYQSKWDQISVDKMTEMADVTKMPWKEVLGDKLEKFGTIIFSYPGPPFESDIFDLLGRRGLTVHKHSKFLDGWLGNQRVRIGSLKKSQSVGKSWEYFSAKAEAEFAGCVCMENGWAMLEYKNRTINDVENLVRNCRKQIYKQWKKLAMTARLSSCLIDSDA